MAVIIVSLKSKQQAGFGNGTCIILLYGTHTLCTCMYREITKFKEIYISQDGDAQVTNTYMYFANRDDYIMSTHKHTRIV